MSGKAVSTVLPGTRGTLVSERFLEEDLPRLFAGEIGEAARDRASRRIRRAWEGWTATLGPASSLRAIIDVAALPLAEVLEFETCDAGFITDQPAATIVLRARDGATVLCLVTSWGADLDALWRTSVRAGASVQATWCFCFNATHLRLVDARRTYARRFIEFDLETATAHPDTLAALWALFRADAYASPAGHATGTPDAPQPPPLIDRVIASSAARAVGVCASLKQGVFEALLELVRGFIAAGPRNRVRHEGPALPSGVLDESLTVVYRILFLLYAEARGLLPVWHPIYRESYAIETLRSAAEHPAPQAGLWEALQAMSRLAHAGCRAGTLTVTPFNGRLFSPTQAPLAERCALDDEAVRRAILALTTEPGRGGGGRRRLAYRDLGVEQLGSVYEAVLDYEPRVSEALAPQPAGSAGSPPSPFRVSVHLEPGSGRRKASGTFYTPRSITEYLVRSALEPLVADASPDDILRLRILDPSMGSGAFLVAACRHLAGAYESALLREGRCHPGDIGESDRSAFRRTIAERCLYGVDLNPMAVQLARVSLWLTTLAADRPLTFLDHALRVGDSLVGASLDDLARQPPGPALSRAGIGPPLPLFEAQDLHSALREVLPIRQRIAEKPSDSIAEVRCKEADLARLNTPRSQLSPWKSAADLWCASWFWDADPGRPDRRTYRDLALALLHGGGSLPERTAKPLLAAARDIAARRSFFHWTLEFPEAFFDAGGRPLVNPGFDVVIGNPPWEMLRADDGEGTAGKSRRMGTRRLISFARESGIYATSGSGHVNLFQLFVERAVRLTRGGGRLGLVVPWGLASDHGCAALRRLLLERADTDTWIGFENTGTVFPIHRSVRFLVLVSTRGPKTGQLRCRFGERDPVSLDRIPQGAREGISEHFPVVLTPALLRRLSGDDLGIPDIRTRADLAIVERLSTAHPPLASPEGWGAEFSRELNASDDRRHFLRGKGPLPVVEGKCIAPFRVDLASCSHHVREEDAARLLDAARTFRRARLAYRDVASATNRLTLIAAVVPAGCVTTHTLFCLRSRLSATDQAFLCGLFNSYVANYLVRQRVTTHVGASIIGRIPAPRPGAATVLFREAVDLSAMLAKMAIPEEHAGHARLQALMALAYGLTPSEFSHVLDSFPLVDPATRRAAHETFRAISP